MHQFVVLSPGIPQRNTVNSHPMLKLPSLFTRQDSRSLQELEARADALRAAKARYARIFSGAHGYGFMDWNVIDRQITWSGGFWSYLGYGNDDMSDLVDPDGSMEYLHEEDRERVYQGLLSVLRGNDEQEIIFRLRKKTGGYVWTEVRFATDRDASGWVNYISGVAFDITHLKQTEDALQESEKRYHRIIQSTSDGIWEWTEKRGEFHFSDRCWQQLGYAQGDDEITPGQNRFKVWREHIHRDDVMRFDLGLHNHMKNNSPYDVEYRVRNVRGEWQWIHSRAQMLFNEKGEPSRMSGTNVDITDLKRAEEEVLRSKEEAERANRAKSDFLSSMSHELRTPLNAILAYSQIIEMDSNLTDDQRSNNREIKKAGLHLKQLVGDVLDLAKIEAGGLRFPLKETSIYKLVKECLLLIRAQIQSKEIKVIVDANDNHGVNVLASPMHLRQVILNLLSNAIKYNRVAGSIHITITQTSDFKLVLCVRDTGLGMPIELQKDLFQPFNRLGAEGGNIEGTGVGLVITQKLVQQMGGEIGFSSEVGVGSSFRISLPAVESYGDRKQKLTKNGLQDKQEAFSSGLNITGDKKILYVEDNLSNQRVMQQTVARFPQLTVHVEREGMRGVYTARALKPDLIILDISMPGMDGYEVLNVLKQDEATKTIPVVALTAQAMSQDIQRGKNMGFSHYITKPVDIGTLIDVFNQTLAQ